MIVDLLEAVTGFQTNVNFSQDFPTQQLGDEAQMWSFFEALLMLVGFLRPEKLWGYFFSNIVLDNVRTQA